ncbi:MAG: hypothetical protein U9O94_08190 [Nanoarchaeota archaeon]|nr:hypothetical protein [Nanoarchaeota archaeon]
MEEHKEEHKTHDYEEHNKIHHDKEHKHSEHHKVHHDKGHQHEEHHKTHHVKEEHHKVKRDDLKLNKTTVWTTVSLILAILLVASILTNGFSGTSSGTSGVISTEDSFIFLGSDSCTTQCDEMEPVAKEIVEKSGLTFQKAKYFQPVEIPGYLLIKDGVVSLNGIQDKSSFVQQICDATASEEVCGEVGAAQAEAEKEASKTAEQKCEELEKVDRPKLEVFYVSKCPFGVQSINSLYYVAKNFGDKVDVVPRLLINTAPDGKTTTSMHGAEEHTEDLRHLCLWNEQKDVYWDYINCYAETGDSAGCEGTAKVDSAMLADCEIRVENDYGLQEASEWETVYRPLGGGGSPSFFLNGKKINEYDFSANGRSPENIKDIICCGMNEKIPECQNALSTTQPPRGFGNLEDGEAGGSDQLNCG